jgi:hypothetical protein
MIPNNGRPFVRWWLIEVCAFALALLATARVGADEPVSPMQQYARSISDRVADRLHRPVRLVVLSADGGEPIPAALTRHRGKLGPEGFCLHADQQGALWVAADQERGLIYGCDEVADRLRDGESLDGALSVVQVPAMPLRAAEFTVSPAGWGSWRSQVPITRQTVPWFYDLDQWRRNLDRLADERFNALVWWSSHPFPQFMNFDRYPEVQDVAPETLRDNVETMRQITEECAKRGIWFIVFFYNIHYSPSFAKAHGLNADGVDSPLTREYTQYWISEWIRRYPGVGLMTTAGEAVPANPEEWIADVILPGIKAGVDPGQPLPPFILRAYLLDLDKFKTLIAPKYENLYTMWKWNNETIAQDRPDPSHAEWVAASRLHGVNVHTVQNLKPYRWSPPDFIRRMVRNSHEMGVRWLHLYSMWYEWPWSADRRDAPLEQTERDWAYYEAFGRYMWDPFRAPEAERTYWNKRCAEHFGLSLAEGDHVRTALEASGQINPLLSSVLFLGGNTEPARTWQPVSGPPERSFGWGVDFHIYAFGATIDQLCQCPGLRGTPPNGGTTAPLRDWPGAPLSPSRFAEAEARGQTIRVLAPLVAADQVEAWGKEAETALAALAPTRHVEEFQRLRQDLLCRRLEAEFYAQKIRAAVAIKRWVYRLARRGEDDRSLQKLAIDNVRRSLETYRRLAQVSESAYVGGTDFPRLTPVNGARTWSAVTPVYEKELEALPGQFDVARKALTSQPASEKR